MRETIIQFENLQNALESITLARDYAEQALFEVFKERILNIYKQHALNPKSNIHMEFRVKTETTPYEYNIFVYTLRNCSFGKEGDKLVLIPPHCPEQDLQALITALDAFNASFPADPKRSRVKAVLHLIKD